MDSMSLPSAPEEAGDNRVKYKFLFPRKPLRQPNPIIHRKLRRGSAVSRLPDKKYQLQYPTNMELMRTLAYLRNATAAFDENGDSDKILPYQKTYHDDDIYDDEEEYNTQTNDDVGKEQLPTSNQPNERFSHMLTRKKKNKTTHMEQAKKECGICCSSSHVISIAEKHQTRDGGHEVTEKLQKSASTYKAFVEFCSEKIIYPQEQRVTLAVKLYGIKAALLSALGSPFDFLPQSHSAKYSSHVLLNLGQASTRFLPAMIWTGMFMLSFAYTTMVAWSLPFRVPIISMLLLSLLYCLSILARMASGISVVWGTFRMPGILFASVGAVGFILLVVFLVILVLFASWRYSKEEQKGI